MAPFVVIGASCSSTVSSGHGGTANLALRALPVPILSRRLAQPEDRRITSINAALRFSVDRLHPLVRTRHLLSLTSKLRKLVGLMLLLFALALLIPSDEQELALGLPPLAKLGKRGLEGFATNRCDNGCDKSHSALSLLLHWRSEQVENGRDHNADCSGELGVLPHPILRARLKGRKNADNDRTDQRKKPCHDVLLVSYGRCSSTTRSSGVPVQYASTAFVYGVMNALAWSR